MNGCIPVSLHNFFLAKDLGTFLAVCAKLFLVLLGGLSLLFVKEVGKRWVKTPADRVADLPKHLWARLSNSSASDQTSGGSATGRLLLTFGLSWLGYLIPLMAWAIYRKWSLPALTGAIFMFLTAPLFIPWVHKLAKAIGYRARDFGDVFVLTYGALAAAGTYTALSLKLFSIVARSLDFVGRL